MSRSNTWNTVVLGLLGVGNANGSIWWGFKMVWTQMKKAFRAYGFHLYDGFDR